jgi:hypothetical protein
MESVRIIEALRDSDIDELHQIVGFIHEYQNCVLVEPIDANSRICVIICIQQMLVQKGSNDLIRRASRLKHIVRWFLEHNIYFTLPQYTFFRWMSRTFTYTITDTNIRLENRLGRVFHISRDEMDLSRFAIQIENNPTNFFLTYFDHDYEDEYISVNIPETSQSTTNKLNRNINNDEKITDETRGLECKICTINKICVVLATCGHTFCYSCTTRFENKCATCRTPFTDETKIRMYI